MNRPLRRLRFEFRSSKPLHQREHRAATMRALPHSRRTSFRLDGIDIAPGGTICSSCRRAAGDGTYVVDCLRSRRSGCAQSHAEAHAKGSGAGTHRLSQSSVFVCCGGVILPAERHAAIGEVNDSVIGDGNAMGVAGQVMKDVLRPPNGGLAYTTQSWRKSERRKERNADSFSNG